MVFSYRPCGEFVGLSSRSGLCNSSACQCGHHLFALQVARALLSIATSKKIIRLEWSIYEFALFVSSAEMSVGEHRPVERPPLHGCIVNVSECVEFARGQFPRSGFSDSKAVRRDGERPGAQPSLFRVYWTAGGLSSPAVTPAAGGVGGKAFFSASPMATLTDSIACSAITSSARSSTDPAYWP